MEYHTIYIFIMGYIYIYLYIGIFFAIHEKNIPSNLGYWGYVQWNIDGNMEYETQEFNIAIGTLGSCRDDLLIINMLIC